MAEVAEPFEPDPDHAGEGTGVHRVDRPSVTIIGAGVAGLTCALELSLRGVTAEQIAHLGQVFSDAHRPWYENHLRRFDHARLGKTQVGLPREDSRGG